MPIRARLPTRLPSPSLPAFHLGFRFISTSSKDASVVIVGAGFSGLSTAYFLRRALSEEGSKTTKITLLEKRNRAGGWCKSVKVPLSELTGQHKDGYAVFETGPRSIRPVGLQGWLTIQITQEIGLSDSLLYVSKSHPSAKNRYLFHPSSVRKLPSSLSDVLSAIFLNPTIRSAIPGIVLEPFRRRRSSSDAGNGEGDESVDAFVSRRLGKPLAENLMSGMIHGIYSGDTRRLSVRTVFPMMWDAERRAGSLIKALWRRPKDGNLTAYQEMMRVEKEGVERIKERMKGSEDGKEVVRKMEESSVWGVRGGLDVLTDSLRDWLVRKGGVQIVQGAGVESIESGQNGRYTVKTATATYHPTHLATSDVSVLPASLSPPSIPSSTVAVVNLAFHSSTPLFPPGFGYLIPRSIPSSLNPHHALGVIFDSDAMPGVDDSASSDLIKVSVLMGGSYWLDRPSSDLPEVESLKGAALDTVRAHFPGVKIPDPIYSAASLQVNCIPQVPPGSIPSFREFGKRVSEASESEKGGTKVAVVGGGFSPIGVNGAVKTAWEVGEGFARDIEGRGKSKTGLEIWDVL